MKEAWWLFLHQAYGCDRFGGTVFAAPALALGDVECGAQRTSLALNGSRQHRENHDRRGAAIRSRLFAYREFRRSPGASGHVR